MIHFISFHMNTVRANLQFHSGITIRLSTTPVTLTFQLINFMRLCVTLKYYSLLDSCRHPPRKRRSVPAMDIENLTHKVEVPLAAESVRDEADYLVEGDAAVDDDRRPGFFRHHPVHLLVHEPEGNRFIADERLVMTLGVCDVLLAIAPVHQRPRDLLHAPIFIFCLFQRLTAKRWEHIK